ncbi:solute carrier family 28 member 3-like [Amphiura filiformis]|uniref:solute carrier family 28 member 3-like n=1 Tax=Amphiura filiformis TaxID=82378 RepID=UPI003B21603E
MTDIEDQRYLESISIDQMKLKLRRFYQTNEAVIWRFMYFVSAMGYLAYIIYACIYDMEVQPLRILLVGVIVATLYFLTKDNPSQLISLAGLAVFVLISLLISRHPRHINWNPVIWGLAIQFALGLFILRTKVGFYLFNFMGDFTKTFTGYVSAGCIFVFGDTYQDHFFAFEVISVIIYFCSVVAVLYYLGIMQALITKISWFMQHSIKTTAPESMNAACNIIVGMSEAEFLIGPYIKKMIKSELMAIMCCGLATMSASTIGVYGIFGIDTVHLLAALVMSSPAALAIAKLLYPETEESQLADAKDLALPKSEEHNVIEAATVGASQAIPAVLNIIANLIVFVALLALINGVLAYTGGLMGFPELSVELIFTYLFMPIAYMMGVEWDDCGKVAELLGIKTFINEFVAYERLGELITNREDGTGATISVRSEVIATYSLCGFDNFGAVGMQLGTLCSIVPDRKQDFSGLAVRSLIGGILACYVTACTAGKMPYHPSNARGYYIFRKLPHHQPTQRCQVPAPASDGSKAT